MSVLNTSSVNVALPKMMYVFGVSTDKIQWVITAYLLALGVAMPIAGFLGDTYGYKRVYSIALSLFVFGSFLCSVSWSINTLIVSRVIQAIGGGILSPLGMSIIYRSCPRSKIGLALSVWGLAAFAAPAIGPTFGGYLVEYVNWQCVFFINIPIGIINLFFISRVMTETPLVKGKEADLIGIAASTGGFFSILLALSEATDYGWTSPLIVALFFIAIVCFIILVHNELNHPNPILDLRLFKNFNFVISLLIGAILSISMTGGVFLVTLLIQNGLGQSPLNSGLITFPAAIFTSFFTLISGRIYDQYGPNLIVFIGLALLAGSTYEMSRVNMSTSLHMITIYLVIRGIGLGLSLTPVLNAGMSRIPTLLIGRASSLYNVLRQVAASFGIAIFTSTMQTHQVIRFAALTESINLQGINASQIPTSTLLIANKLGISISQAQDILLSSLTQHLALISLCESITDCFLMVSILCIVALLISPLLAKG
jgi:EmrB/QacA subfamily drug resistance transporter